MIDVKGLLDILNIYIYIYDMRCISRRQQLCMTDSVTLSL